MAQSIDLNSDLGEGFGPWSMGDDATMLGIVTSANIACGGHASDPETMFQTLVAARENGVIVGAHPGYNDREGFGRRVIPMDPAQITRLCAAQIGALQAVAALAGTRVSYVKAHGALANLSARDRTVADAIVRAVAALDNALPVLAISGTQTEGAARAAGQPVYSEVFADRGYLASGQLVPRGQDGAMIHDADFAADRLLELLETGHMPVIDGAPIALDAHSICVHGDSPGAVTMAARIRSRLEDQGVTIRGFLAKWTPDISFKPAGDCGLLVTVATEASDAANDRVIALDAALSAANMNGVKETIPALVNLMVLFDPLVTDHVTIADAVSALFPLPKTEAGTAQTHVIPVCYDVELCPDLVATAKTTGLTPDAVIDAHVTARLRVSMYGFAPGYAYLSGLPPEIHVPRKTKALRDVPKGSILIAGAQSILTPLTMPTGWNIIGRSPTEVILEDRFVFAVGDIVTFTRIPRADLPDRLQA